MSNRYFTYIVTNKSRTTLYIGVTNNIQRRLSEHYPDSQNAKSSFVSKYNCYDFPYYETFECVNTAILREKTLKYWSREKKNQLIRLFNPSWESLNNQIF